MNAPRPRLYRVATVGRILEIGERAVFARLRSLDILTTDNRPTGWAVQQGYAVADLREYRYPIPGGGNQHYVVALITEEGLHWIREQVHGKAA